MMGLISNGISGVRAFELPVGVWADGRTVGGPRVCLIRWRSAWLDKVHQVYVNGRYAGTTVDSEQRQLVVQTPSCFERAARVEVFAVEPGEAEVDFGDELGRSKGDSGQIKLSFLRSQRLAAGARYEVYYDGGNGNIDYEQSIGAGQIWAYQEDKAGFGLARFGEGDWGYEWAGGVGFGRGNFGSGEFGVNADIIEWVSPALEAGVYRFGIKVIDERGNESAASETGEVTVIPAAKPANKLNVLIFDKETNEMVLGISSEQ
jgi:hypothetical protein